MTVFTTMDELKRNRIVDLLREEKAHRRSRP